MCLPISRAIQKHEGKVEALPCTTLRKKPFSSTSGEQRSFQRLEILSHLAGLNKAWSPDTLECMGNHKPPGSHLHPVPTLTRQIDYVRFFSKVNFLFDESLTGSLHSQVMTLSLLFTEGTAKRIRQAVFMV